MNMSWEGDCEDAKNWYLNKDMNYHKNIKNNMPRIEGEQKYFTAKEARNVSDEISSQNMNKELDWIYKLIDEARFKGEYTVKISDKNIMQSTENFLISKGFDVHHWRGCQKDPCNDTTISWGDNK